MNIIITGASSGIGKQLALKYYKEGHNIVLAARNIEILNSIKENYNLKSPKTLLVKTDVTKEKDCKNLIESTINFFGSINILINNAGISMRSLFIETDIEVLKKIMNVNFWGSVYCTKYALPYILKEKGSIVGVSSIAGYKGLPARTGYSASKFALQGFLESLRIEHMHDGLHILIASPGFTASNIRKSALGKSGKKIGETSRNEKKMMSANKVANYIYCATLKRKRSLILTTQGKITVFLNKIFPTFLDKLIYNHLSKEQKSPLN